MRRAFLALAVLNLAIVGWAIFDEAVTRRPWKAVQAEFNRVLEARGQEPVPVAIREVTNPALGLHDRCQTCHLGILSEGFGEDVPTHLRTHPRAAQLLGPHPPDRFGCTPCHGGQGPQTKGVARAKFDHGRDDPYWERPLLRDAFVQASCLDCHDTPPEGAEVLARGKALFESLQCGGCHLAKNVGPPAAPAAPPLGQLRQKLSQAFVEEWLRAPGAVRPHTRMPDFWPAGAGPERAGEPAAVAAYLASVPPGPPLPAFAFDGDLEDPALIEEGRVLFDRVGCRGCHLLSAQERFEGGASPPLAAHFGPSLDAVGEKATAQWLAAWLRDPRAVWKDARMPKLSLGPAQLTRLVAFLGTLRREGKPPASSQWQEPEPALAAAGREAILRLGCSGCHELPGILREGRPGPDLDAFGDRTPEELSFGDAQVDCGDRSKLECFALEKLRTPRAFQTASTALVMPAYELADADREALAVYLLSNRSRKVPPDYLRPLDGRERALQEGEELVARHNCEGCHALSGDPERPRGGWVRRFYQEPALAPPSLAQAGKKLQPSWLWDFLREPAIVRPFLAARMPDYGLGDEEVDALARWLAVRDGEPYPVQRPEPGRLTLAERPEAARLFDQVRCVQCHPAQGAAAEAGRAVAELAPDLALAPRRLRGAWVRSLLLDPQKQMPGTRMPTYFSPVDEEDPEGELNALPGFFGDDAHRQLDALTDVVMAPANPAPAAPSSFASTSGAQ